MGLTCILVVGLIYLGWWIPTMGLANIHPDLPRRIKLALNIVGYFGLILLQWVLGLGWFVQQRYLWLSQPCQPILPQAGITFLVADPSDIRRSGSDPRLRLDHFHKCCTAPNSRRLVSTGDGCGGFGENLAVKIIKETFADEIKAPSKSRAQKAPR